MKKITFALILATTIALSSVGRAAFVDYGLTLGTFKNNGSVVSNGSGLWELGVFSGYNDTLGASYFDGKDYATLRSSWSSFSGSSSNIDSTGGFYVSSVDLGTTAVNTRLFAWGFSSTTASSSANWSVISGTIGDTGTYGPSWLAVAPADITVNTIEVGTTFNTIYAKSAVANSFQANSVAISEQSANVLVVPEPSTYALLAIGGIGMAGYVIRRRRRA